MVKQQTNESSEFTMSSEDFPALPGSQPERANQSDQGMENSGSLAIGGSAASKQQKQGIQTHPDGQLGDGRRWGVTHLCYIIVGIDPAFVGRN